MAGESSTSYHHEEVQESRLIILQHTIAYHVVLYQMLLRSTFLVHCASACVGEHPSLLLGTKAWNGMGTLLENRRLARIFRRCTVKQQRLP